MKICPKFLYGGPDIPWMNPQCVGINNLPPRTHLHVYSTEKKAKIAEPRDFSKLNFLFFCPRVKEGVFFLGRTSYLLVKIKNSLEKKQTSKIKYQKKRLL